MQDGQQVSTHTRHIEHVLKHHTFSLVASVHVDDDATLTGHGDGSVVTQDDINGFLEGGEVVGVHDSRCTGID